MPRISVGALVREWYRRLPKPIRTQPTLDVPQSEKALIVSLLREELEELELALDEGDLVRVADAIADIVYVAYGASLQFGFDLDDVLAEVHSSNMSKAFADGHFEFDSAGKVVRGPAYQTPKLADLLGRAGSALH